MLKQNRYSVEEIACKVGYSKDHLYHLMNGNPSTGVAGQLFQAEYTKITSVIEGRSIRKGAMAKERAIDKLLSWVNSVSTKDILTKQRHKQLIDTINALSKAVPSIPPKEYMENRAMSPDELFYEFKRLQTLAAVSSNRSAVKEFKPDDSAE